jgi:hypothetical protein
VLEELQSVLEELVSVVEVVYCVLEELHSVMEELRSWIFVSLPTSHIHNVCLSCICWDICYTSNCLNRALSMEVFCF